MAVSMTVWLAAFTGYYVWTAVHTVRHPFNPGDDREWAAAAIAVLAAGALLFAAFPGRLVARVGLAALAILCVAVVVFSGQLVAALVVVWLLGLGGFYGDRLLRWIGAVSPGIHLERTAVGLPLGLAVLAVVGFTLGAARLLTPAGVAAVLAVLSLAPGRYLWKRLRIQRDGAPAVRHSPDRVSVENGFLFTLMGFVFFLGLAWAVAPEIHYDALNYHLAVPKLYVESGGFMDLPYFWHSYFAQSVETLFALPLALEGQTAARLLNLTFGVILAHQVFLLGRFVAGSRAGLWAAAIFASTPLVFWLSVTTYVETATAMFVTAALLAFLRWREQRQKGWLWAAILLGGAAIGAKPTAALAVPVVALVAVRDLFRERRPGIPVWQPIGALLAAAALALPWYALRYVYTGNPTFPLLSGVFEGSRRVPEGFTLALLGTSFGSGRSAPSLTELPFRFTFETGRFGEMIPPGGVGLAILLLLPLGAFLLLLRRSSVSVLLGVAASYYLLWSLSSPYARYLVPILPLVVALGAATVASLSPPRRHPNWILLSLALVAQVLVIPVQFWNIPERIPLRLALGRESREEFLSRSLRAYPATRLLNDVVEPGEKILGVGVDGVRFYVNAPLGSWVETWELAPILAEPSRRRVAGELKKEGYSYLVVDTLSPASRLPLSVLNPKFLDGYATPVFRRAGIDVYRLLPPAESRPAGVGTGP